MDQLPTTLIDLLSNSIILRQTIPYLPIRELRRLTLTSKALRELLYSSPDAWRHLNLTTVRRAIIDSSPIDVGGMSWRAERMDESLTEDDFYAGPLRGILGSLHSKQVLKHVSTLILDGLSVPADLVREIISEDRYRVRILSVRECKNLNLSKLQQVLRYVTRPTRAEGTPVLQAMYIFGPKDGPQLKKAIQLPDSSPSLGVMGLQGAQIGAEWNQRSSEVLHSTMSDEQSKWYGCTGRAIRRPLSDWAETLTVCKDIISFDAVLCRGPRHDITKVSSEDFLQPSIATVALGPSGCESCKTTPEIPAIFSVSSDSHLPLLGPVPSHSPTLRAALRPGKSEDSTFPRLILRCEDCLRGRWCEQCNRWWCENCYPDPVSRAHTRTEMQQLELREELQSNGWVTATTEPKLSTKVGVHRDCFECGRTCEQCKSQVIKNCRQCLAEYCFPHDEHCSEVKCGWCNYIGRRTREEF
ncbi:uncharacterized protein RCC_01786 [Ramularia collo-cygni]|uniref:F-box domain-containing protein n=1 Tax=Ramularia collo-cygni TaxID=112498 RepID=A0A2D3UV58_9PEZI|nr:uncharacterized protein RCC_01786 [Ramularia collo-cygni]CZT15947.1 uncharacterized protein RCC_01786 [Ramularia collo-cygni]